jgi:hypothetical protein
MAKKMKQNKKKIAIAMDIAVHSRKGIKLKVNLK